jgi:hypothetical protein
MKSVKTVTLLELFYRLCRIEIEHLGFIFITQSNISPNIIRMIQSRRMGLSDM